MVGFDVRSQGLHKTLNTAKPIDLQWDMKTIRNEKGMAYENRYTDIRFEYEGEKDDYTGQGKDKTETPSQVSFIAFKQHFFSSTCSRANRLRRRTCILQN
jgi:YidC/Oxa1 family membrane protein insertase